MNIKRCLRERKLKPQTMWNARENGETRQGDGVVAVAVDKEKFSQYALKWAVDNLFPRDKPLKLIHVVQRSASPPQNPAGSSNTLIQQDPQPDTQALEVLLPYRCYCTRRQVQFETVILYDPDVAKALNDYVALGGVETLLLGSSSSWNSLSRLFKNSDVSSSVLKFATQFCNVYIISKGKVSAMRPACRSASTIPAPAVETTQPIYHNLNAQVDPDLLDDEVSMTENDNTSGRLSTDSNCLSFYENLGCGPIIGSSDLLNSDLHEPNLLSSSKNVNLDALNNSTCIGRLPFYLQSLDQNMDDEITRVKLELKETMDMYHVACRESIIDLQDWKMKQEQRMKEIESAIIELVEKEKETSMAAIEAAHRLAEQEVEKRVLKAEIKAMIHAEEKQKVLNALSPSQMVLKYQSFFHIIFLFLFCFYFSLFK